MKVRAIGFDPGDISQLEMKTAYPRVLFLRHPSLNSCCTVVFPACRETRD